jgi:hypothetical protein
VLDPFDRISEVLFGLIMFLTFTGSLSIARTGRQDVRVMLIGAIGCNIAWGIIDAALYLMGCLADKGRRLNMLRMLHGASTPEAAQRIAAGALPPLVASVLGPSELETIRQRLQQLPEPPPRAQLEKREWIGGLGVFLLVFLSTFPPAVPFFVMHNAVLALRVANLIAILMLFLIGSAYGRCVGQTSWKLGVAMVVLGSVLVLTAIAFGG